MICKKFLSSILVLILFRVTNLRCKTFLFAFALFLRSRSVENFFQILYSYFVIWNNAWSFFCTLFKLNNICWIYIWKSYYVYSRLFKRLLKFTLIWICGQIHCKNHKLFACVGIESIYYVFWLKMFFTVLAIDWLILINWLIEWIIDWLIDWF